MIPPYEALVAMIVQAIFYGLYTATFILCIRWLIFIDEGWRLRPRHKTQWPILILTIILFIFVTTDLGTSCWITLEDVGISGQESTARDLLLLNGSIERIILIITDAVLIFRCWVVYRKSWRIVVLPLLLWTCTIACTIVLACFWKTVVASMEFFPPFYQSVNATFFSCNLAINLYATCAIIYRVLRVAKTSLNKARHLYNVCQIVAGTGILYVVTSCALLFSASLTGIQSNVFPICDAVNFSMAGITFNLFLIQMGRLRASIADRPNSMQNVSLQRSLSMLRFHTFINTSAESRTVNATGIGRDNDTSIPTPGIISRTLVAELT